MRRKFWIVATVLVLVVIGVMALLPGRVENRINVVLPHEPREISAEARTPTA